VPLQHVTTLQSTMPTAAPERRAYLVAFIHPDLGLGGAERLVVDAAVETVAHGHTCDVYTAYYDPARCFEETKQGLFTITVAGSWFPRSVLGRLHALCAYVRCLLVALYVVLQYRAHGKKYDIIFVDQVG
jgi:alpha-1,3/alpha-1,6-mannosyltransferase